MAKKITIDIFRGQEGEGELESYDLELDEGMVLLDCVHRVQYEQEPELSNRWNCKAGKCGSCSAEINGKPRLMCMTRMSDLLEETPEGTNITVRPMQTFPHVKDLVTDVSWNYEMAKAVVPLKGPKESDWVFSQFEAERAQEFRMCIECFICQDTCHVLREYRKFDEFGGPRTMVRQANIEMHPMDQEDRIPEAKDEFGIGYCNITKCCTDVCPAGINITDNAIIPLKERVVDRYYDPIKMIWRTITGQKLRT